MSKAMIVGLESRRQIEQRLPHLGREVAVQREAAGGWGLAFGSQPAKNQPNNGSGVFRARRRRKSPGFRGFLSWAVLGSNQ
jgi:hypothetical protein